MFWYSIRFFGYAYHWKRIAFRISLSKPFWKILIFKIGIQKPELCNFYSLSLNIGYVQIETPLSYIYNDSLMIWLNEVMTFLHELSRAKEILVSIQNGGRIFAKYCFLKIFLELVIFKRDFLETLIFSSFIFRNHSQII